MNKSQMLDGDIVTWEFKPVVITGTAYGNPVNDRGWSVFTGSVNQKIIDKAIAFLNALFALLDEYQAEIWEDPEAEFAIIDLGNDFWVNYDTERQDVFITYRNHCFAGELKRLTE